MPQAIGSGVTLEGLRSEEFSYTWNITGTAGVNPGIGVAMTQDVSANNSAKVTTDGAVVLGALMSYENRIQEGITVGTIARKGVFVWEYTGTAPTRGAGVVGSATAGKVKAAAGAVVNNIVVAVDTGAATVTVLFD